MNAELLAYPQPVALARTLVRTVEHVPFAERLVTRRLTSRTLRVRPVRPERMPGDRRPAA
jgi:hypothetical protein